MKSIRRLATTLAVGVCCGVARAEESKQAQTQAIDVCLIAEFGYIPEVRSWRQVEEGLISPKDRRNFEQAWEMGWRKKVTDVVTPGVVRQMVMRRDREGMVAYTRVSPLARVDWRPVTMHESYLVFKGTADTLPRVSAVRRWLMIYCLYDTKQGTISRVTLTIHGERDE